MRTAAAALLLTLAAPAALAAPEDDYRQLREEMWEWTLEENPFLATEIGDRRGDGKLGDNSLAAYDRRIAEQRRFLQRLDAIDAGSLPPELAVDYGVLRRSLEDEVAGARFDQDRFSHFTNRGGWHISFSYLADRSPFFTEQDFESYIGRLEAYPRVNSAGIERTRGAIERGVTQPCEPMQGFMRTIEGRYADSAEQSAFWAPFEERPAAISQAEWQQLKARAKQAIESGVLPAYREFGAFYEAEYAPNCRDAYGIGDTPNGADYYGHRVRLFTTTNMTPAEVHQLGLSEVARIRAEMEEVAERAGFDSREAFIEHLRTDPKYYPQTPEELLTAASALAKEIDGWMPKLFGLLPRQPYTVEPIPAEQAVGNTTAYYESGSLATGQPGIYRVNTTELDQRPLWELPALGVHEAVPGHHHQIALQQELDIHPLRAHGTYFTAFVEGWGLYSERLGIEMGLYDTPAKEMGRLSYEMWRAARLVVDTGLHSQGWTKQQAVDFMLENTALSPGNIDAEVNRYITWPGQALAYKLGELKIRELRARAEETLGAEFDLRAFHDAVLKNGAVPLDVLEAQIDRWIAEERQAAA